MGKVVKQSDYNKTIRENPRCAYCSAGCKTHCLRPANDFIDGNETKDDKNDEPNEK